MPPIKILVYHGDNKNGWLTQWIDAEGNEVKCEYNFRKASAIGAALSSNLLIKVFKKDGTFHRTIQPNEGKRQ